MQVEVTRIFETPGDVLYDFLMEKLPVRSRSSMAYASNRKI